LQPIKAFSKYWPAKNVGPPPNFGSASLVFSWFQQSGCGQRLCLYFFVSLPPFFAFVTAVGLVFEPLADRHGGLFKRAETVIQPV